MFDFIQQAEAQQSVCEERLQRALANARREWNQSDTLRPAAYRQMLARVGAALVATGTWLQRGAVPKSASEAQFRPQGNVR